MQRQGARYRTSGGEEIGLSHLTLETKADQLIKSSKVFMYNDMGIILRCKKINYMLESDRLRNSSQTFLGVLKGGY